MRHEHSDHEIDMGLIALFIAGKNSNVAHARLKEQGIDIRPRTLRDWLDRHHERYLELADIHGPRLEKELRAVSKQVALSAAQGTWEAVEAAREQVRTGEARDPSATAKNLAIAGGISTDKALLLENRPTQIHSTQTVDALMDDVRRMLGQRYDAEATAELLEPSPDQG